MDNNIKPETLFDIILDLQASTLDSSQLDELCKFQQSLTMTRIANWLRSNARIYHLGHEVSISKQISSLADELDYLAEIAIDNPYRITSK